MSQLELIFPNGDIRFLNVEIEKGVVNIGRHPENDIVIDAPGVLDFHAVLDCRRRPYQLINFGDNAVTLNGDPVARNMPQEAQPFDQIGLAGYTLLWLDEGKTAPSPMPGAGGRAGGGRAPRGAGGAGNTGGAAIAGGAAAAGMALSGGGLTAGRAPTSAGGSATPATPRPQMIADRPDDIILVELSERTWTVDVDNQVNFTVTITNGGPLVAEFTIEVEGLPAEWVQSSEPTWAVRLFEGRRKDVQLSISAPREPASRAGAHPFVVTVRSEDYPDHLCSRSAMITLNPYYAFDMSELDPKQQAVHFQKNRHTALAVLDITNRSNAELPVRLDGTDDERACQFEFQQGEGTPRRSRQIELRVAPEETTVVTTHITPFARRIFSARATTHPVSFTATLLGPVPLTQVASGMITNRPLFGVGSLLLALALLTFLVILVFRPQLYEFGADRTSLVAGEALTLRWNASPFTTSRIEPEVGELDRTSGTREIKPRDTKVYRLTGENFLSRLLPFLAPPAREIAITVDPVKPKIVSFDANPRSPLTGDTITVFWEVSNGTELSLITNGAPETLPADQIARGQRRVKVEGDLRYELVAKNYYGDDKQNFSIRPNQPTPTPIPPPQIVRFDVKPVVITAGMEIAIEWEVTGADRVTIAPLIAGADGYPPKGAISQKPDRNTSYVLTAYNGPVQVSRQQNVTVGPAPTATPVPLAPVIAYFKALPNPVTVLDANSPSTITLSWQVQGAYTNIEISNPDIGKLSNLTREGTLVVSVAKTTFFLMAASNTPDKVTSQTAEVNALPATPTPTPAPTATPPPTPIPPPLITVFKASSGASPANEAEVAQILDPSLPATTFKYEVLAGARVKFSWAATGADTVKLNGANVPNPGDTTVPLTSATPWNLVATNAGGSSTRFIVITLRPRPVPPPPSQFTGQNSANPPLKLSWFYPSQSQSDIIGFRLYRAKTPGGFTRIADESSGMGPTLRQWDDGTVPTTCGWGYYVVAVYLDLYGVATETAPSANSWYSTACP